MGGVPVNPTNIMKLIIDLNDREMQRQLQLAIDERISAIAAERVAELVSPIIEKKLQRINDKSVDVMAKEAVTAEVKRFLTRPSYQQPSPFENLFREITERIVREGLARK